MGAIKMKINNQILSIPPYISTSWKNINSILVDQSGNLVILLHTNAKISIPNLEKSIINVIFDAHAKYLEKEENDKHQKINPSFSMGLPLKIMGGEGSDSSLESLGAAMQHNPANANAPDLPPDILNKIASISKIMGIDNPEITPKAEPHCNCIHCQIAKAIRGESKEAQIEEIGEEVTEEDLKFKTWEITQTGEQLYVLTNPLDINEKYTVFLGDPLGCTCGARNCEHIRAVLNT
jgi:hypothetical protein